MNVRLLAYAVASRVVNVADPPESGESALAELVSLLHLRSLGGDRFAGASVSRSLPFVFGGQVAAQALAAAYRCLAATVRVHSLHAYFVNAGDPGAGLEFAVERVRDGRSFHLRRVTVEQAGRGPIFVADLSFTEDVSGLVHAVGPREAPSVPPERMRTRISWLAGHADQVPQWWTGPMAFDVRFLEQPPQVPLPNRPPRVRQDHWLRAAGAVAENQWLHDCLLTFASDLTLLDPTVLAHGRSWYLDDLRAASLDHAVWFHRPARVDEWLLYEQVSPVSHGGRALALGRLFDVRGTLLASTAQEGLVRLPGARSTPG
jgi:acyl-CoA thioesterase-2